MKYAVVLYDGMADYPVPAFDGKTPMMIANKTFTNNMLKIKLDSIPLDISKGNISSDVDKNTAINEPKVIKPVVYKFAPTTEKPH